MRQSSYPAVHYQPVEYAPAHNPTVVYHPSQQTIVHRSDSFNGNSQIASPAVQHHSTQPTSGGGFLNSLGSLGGLTNGLTQNLPIQEVTETVSTAVTDVTSQISSVTEVVGQLSNTANHAVSTVGRTAESVTNQIENISGTVSEIANTAGRTANSAVNSATHILPF